MVENKKDDIWLGKLKPKMAKHVPIGVDLNVNVNLPYKELKQAIFNLIDEHYMTCQMCADNGVKAGCPVGQKLFNMDRNASKSRTKNAIEKHALKRKVTFNPFEDWGPPLDDFGR